MTSNGRRSGPSRADGRRRQALITRGCAWSLRRRGRPPRRKMLRPSMLRLDDAPDLIVHCADRERADIGTRGLHHSFLCVTLRIAITRRFRSRKGPHASPRAATLRRRRPRSLALAATKTRRPTGEPRSAPHCDLRLGPGPTLFRFGARPRQRPPSASASPARSSSVWSTSAKVEASPRPRPARSLS